ncbi:MAG: 30S ribosomal protein S1 [Bacteroidota bacterium]
MKNKIEEIQPPALSTNLEGGNGAKFPENPVVVFEPVDWNTIGKKQDVYASDEKNRLDEIYGDTVKNVFEHQVVEGVIVSKNDKEVVVNINFKSDGVIATNEFRYNTQLAIGDKVEVYIEKQEDKNGQLVLSHKKARIVKGWDRITSAFESESIVQGFVKCRTKGGLIVDVHGIECFLPGSQIDMKPVRDYDQYVNKIIELKIVKINQEFRNVVVSHKILIESEIEEQKKVIISKLEKGQVLEGTVKNITSYGVFIDLGGVDGLIHITDLSWERINHPDEIVKLDDKLNVVILDFALEKRRISLGLKQLKPHPWEKLDTNLKVGDKIKGCVRSIEDFGAFVEVFPGVEGLIHVSEISWSQHLRSAGDFLKIGDEVNTVIVMLDKETRKMSLSVKQLTPDPWSTILDKYPKNSKHTAIAKNITSFGIFVELEPGIDGLIHISDLSWNKKFKHPSEFTKVGNKIECMVTEVNVEQRRISMGVKQLEENPWNALESVFTIDSIHKGTIINIVDKGAVVALPYEVEGFSPKKHLIKEDGSSATLKESLDFQILEFDKNIHKVIVSHTRIHSPQLSDPVVASYLVKSTEDTPVESTEDTSVESTEDTPVKSTEDFSVESTENTSVESTENTPVESTENSVSENIDIEFQQSKASTDKTDETFIKEDEQTKE